MRITPSKAAFQLAHTTTPLQSTTGIRSVGGIMVTAEDEGWSLNKEHHFIELLDVVAGVNALRPVEVPQGGKVAARQQEFLVKL